jgi:hypothetical protein
MYDNLLKKRLHKIKECTIDSVVSSSSNVRFICNFEGNLLYFDKELLKSDDKYNGLSSNSLLEIVHPEDLNFLIEKMVDLIQEKSRSVLIETRLLNRQGQTFYSKWYMGYLRGLFYFYPVN